jgi:hypothetical protein
MRPSKYDTDLTDAEWVIFEKTMRVNPQVSQRLQAKHCQKGGTHRYSVSSPHRAPMA